MLLTETDLAQLTGYVQPVRQSKWLDKRVYRGRSKTEIANLTARVEALEEGQDKFRSLAQEVVRNWNFYNGSPAYLGKLHEAMCDLRAALREWEWT